MPSSNGADLARIACSSELAGGFAKKKFQKTDSRLPFIYPHRQALFQSLPPRMLRAHSHKRFVLALLSVTPFHWDFAPRSYLREARIDGALHDRGINRGIYTTFRLSLVL